jgi:hypothetical protein
MFFEITNRKASMYRDSALKVRREQRHLAQSRTADVQPLAEHQLQNVDELPGE